VVGKIAVGVLLYPVVQVSKVMTNGRATDKEAAKKKMIEIAWIDA
jgi:hypothetical protein